MRYAGSRLSQQNAKGEELLIIDVSEIDLLVIKRCPTAIALEESFTPVGKNVYRKDMLLRVRETPETIQARREIQLSMSEDEYERRSKI